MFRWLSPSRSKPTFLWKDQFELICHARLPKTNRFNSFCPKHSEFFFWWNLFFYWSYFLWPLWNWSLGTNMEGNAAVTLQFEHLMVNNSLFLKYVCICWWKISSCSIENCLSMWFNFYFFLKTKWTSVQNRLINALSRKLIHLVFKIFKKKNISQKY